MQVSSDKRQVAPVVRGKHARLMLEDALLGTSWAGVSQSSPPLSLADVVKVRIGSQAPAPSIPAASIFSPLETGTGDMGSGLGDSTVHIQTFLLHNCEQDDERCVPCVQV